MAALRDKFKVQPNCFIWGVSEGLPEIAFPQPMFQTPTYKSIKKLISGSGVNFMIDEDNQLKSWGKSEVGLLGQDAVSQCSEPTLVKFDGRFLKVAIGTDHVVALTLDGKVVTWGSNAKKQLGRPSEAQISRIPMVIESLINSTITTIAVFENSSYAVSNKGELFSWGSNQKMELGHSSTSFSVLEPVVIATITQPVKKVARCGGFIVAVCRRDGVGPLPPKEEVKAEPPPAPKAADQESAQEEAARAKSTAKSLDESASNYKENPDEGKVEYAELVEDVTRIVSKLKGLHDILFQIDQAMIFAFQSRGGGTVQGVVSMIHIAGELLEDFSQKEIVKMKENTHLDPNLREQLVVFEKIGLDALNLRKVNYVCGKMFLRCIKLKSNSYEEVRTYVKSKNAAMPQKSIIEDFQNFCLKATMKIRNDTIEVESLQQGVNDLTSYAMTYALDAAVSFSESWMLLNNILSKVNPEVLAEDVEASRKAIVLDLWNAYKDVGKSSLDVLMEKHKYDIEEYHSFQLYADKLFQDSDKILTTAEQRLSEIKPRLTELSGKKMYRIVTENIELRKLLNETQRRLLNPPSLR